MNKELQKTQETIIGDVTGAMNSLEKEAIMGNLMGKREGNNIVLYRKIGRIELSPKKATENTDASFIKKLLELYAENIM